MMIIEWLRVNFRFNEYLRHILLNFKETINNVLEICKQIHVTIYVEISLHLYSLWM